MCLEIRSTFLRFGSSLFQAKVLERGKNFLKIHVHCDNDLELLDMYRRLTPAKCIDVQFYECGKPTSGLIILKCVGVPSMWDEYSFVFGADII